MSTIQDHRPARDGVGAGSVIAANALTVGHGTVPYVKDLSLQVGEGEIFALLGANGAGKTTTLMGLAGLLKPMGGSVEIAGTTVTTPFYQRARSGLAFVTQDRCVFMGLSLRDNLKVGGVDPDQALDYFPELKEHLGRTVGLLSGGQQQMLAVARAIARRPKILLADELSLGLAPMVVDRILDALVRACEVDRLAVLLVEQQVTTALTSANRGGGLRRGKLEHVDDGTWLRGRMAEVEAPYL